MSDAESAIVQSVDRAAQILEMLAENGLMGVSDISRRIGVHRSTAFRLLATLEARNLVEQEEHRGLYRLGLGVLRLAGAVNSRIDLVRDAQACCDLMASRLNETTNVAILDDGAAVNITQATGRQLIAVLRQYVGQRTPLNATSTGKVLLAHSSSAVVDAALAEPLERFTRATITDPSVLRAELERVRAQGWAAADEEWETGTNAVAVPVRGSDGHVVAAMSVTAPSFRMPSSSFGQHADVLREGAADLGRRLGHLAQLTPGVS